MLKNTLVIKAVVGLLKRIMILTLKIVFTTWGLRDNLGKVLEVW